jgi:lysozyme
MNVIDLLGQEEGFKSKAYHCTQGYPTIGIGWRIGRRNQPLSDFEHMVISRPAAEGQLQYEVFAIEQELGNHDWFTKLNEARQAVIVSMAYQMGISGLMKFQRMIAAIKENDWCTAADEGLDSRWAKQTPERANRQMKTLLCGDWSWYEV